MRSVNCSGCGASLPIVEGREVVVCEYCGTHNVVPVAHEPPAPMPVPRTRTSSGGWIILLVLLPLILAAGSALVSMLLRPGSLTNAVRGAAAGLVSRDAVVPSWEAVDGLETARNIVRQVEGRWRPGARAVKVSWHRVRPDGTLDLETDEQALIVVEFLDTALLENVVPGETSIKGASLGVSVLQGFVNGMVSDASIALLEHVYIDRMPGCGLATLRTKAAQAGYPDQGYAMVRFPEIPHDLTADGMDFRLSFVRPDGEELKQKIERQGWDPGRFTYYSLDVPNLASADLPRYFDPGDCSPVDIEKIQDEQIEKLRGR